MTGRREVLVNLKRKERGRGHQKGQTGWERQMQRRYFRSGVGVKISLCGWWLSLEPVALWDGVPDRKWKGCQITACCKPWNWRRRCCRVDQRLLLVLSQQRCSLQRNFIRIFPPLFEQDKNCKLDCFWFKTKLISYFWQKVFGLKILWPFLMYLNGWMFNFSSSQTAFYFI